MAHFQDPFLKDLANLSDSDSDADSQNVNLPGDDFEILN